MDSKDLSKMIMKDFERLTRITLSTRKEELDKWFIEVDQIKNALNSLNTIKQLETHMILTLESTKMEVHLVERVRSEYEIMKNIKVEPGTKSDVGLFVLWKTAIRNSLNLALSIEDLKKVKYQNIMQYNSCFSSTWNNLCLTHQVPEIELIKLYLGGLPESLAEAGRSHFATKMELKTIQTALERRCLVEIETSATPRASASISPVLVDNTEVTSPDLNAITRPNNNDNKHCNKCGRNNHWTNECRAKTLSTDGVSNSVPIICGNCGEKNHFARDCRLPRKASVRGGRRTADARPQQKKE